MISAASSIRHDESDPHPTVEAAPSGRCERTLTLGLETNHDDVPRTLSYASSGNGGMFPVSPSFSRSTTSMRMATLTAVIHELARRW